MAQQDKTDWYWNGVLAGSVNNLYYDLINVDITHVPYSFTQRNSSFFLKNRMSYVPAEIWKWVEPGRDVTDIKIIRENKCDKSSWTVYALAANPFRTKWRIYRWNIVDGCVDKKERHDTFDTIWCWDWRLFITDYVKWPQVEDVMDWDCSAYSTYSWIQVNEYEWWTTHWYFSDKCVEEWKAKFRNTLKWYFLLVYDSKNNSDSWFAGQVRLITDVDSKWRLVLNAPWQWFATLSSEDDEPAEWGDLKYSIFKDWWEVVWYSTWNNIYVVTNVDNGGFVRVSPYSQISPYLDTNIIWVASAANKIFVLTDNWWIHYTNTPWWYDKFFIQEDMFAWIDKTSVASYRDFVVTFWKNHLGICVPDNENKYYTIYNQSTTVWLWSRYSYWEYDWDLIFVSNDKRLLALSVASNTWKYMLEYKDVWETLNSKLSILLPWDEVFVWDNRWELRIFVNYHTNPYVSLRDDLQNYEYAKEKWWSNTSTHIYKFDKLFKVWTEDHISGFCLWWVLDWIYFWENGIYARDIWVADVEHWSSVSTDIVAEISAYLIENESDWIGWTTSWLKDRAKLYNLAKLNRLITILGPWKYSDNTKICITSYVNWVWVDYEFPIWTSWDDVNNVWVDQITKNYIWDDTELEECQLEVVKDSQKAYKTNCTSSRITPYSAMQDKPWCDSYQEILLPSHWVCVDDSIYKLAPSMPLVTNLWENQNYATQIKIKLTSRNDDISFGWWLWEMFIAPLFTTWPDWEYQLQPETDC